ncbi:ABC transporter substrate-binding protein [Romboutsia weinsteinii]|uniref:ABC transporter substrate-binding protein n=1 Tax=Romboutsia weinsteinii TaxID=2020949 RepID=A0A371IZD8_9FIRM|nr:ABC transporter substrate-binding protein [Romboutsia weinsteinii]RDY25852.1 ABC transporter substrate-binding protein [Romboutsia weinsteinii]
MKKIISTILLIALGSISLIGCSQNAITNNKKSNSDKLAIVNKEVMISAPDGLPAIAISKLAKEKPIIKDGYEVTYSVEATSESLSTTVMKEEPDIAIVPSNMAAIAYNKTSSYKIAGTVGMGSFYLVSTEDINDFNELVGKKVGNTGKSLTPDITVQTVLKEKGINVDDIDFNYVNSASELVPLLVTDKLNTAFVPEPALSALMEKNKDIKIIKSLNDGWKEVANSKQGYPQSTIIIKSDFAENNQEFVEAFLGQLSNSIDWANDSTNNAGEYAKEIGVTTDPNIINKSMERANLKFISVKDMIEDYNSYYQKLYNFDPKTVGGTLPDEGIYLVEE